MRALICITFGRARRGFLNALRNDPMALIQMIAFHYSSFPHLLSDLDCRSIQRRLPYTQADRQFIVSYLANSEKPPKGRAVSQELAALNDRHSAQSYQTFLRDNYDKGAQLQRLVIIERARRAAEKRSEQAAERQAEYQRREVEEQLETRVARGAMDVTRSEIQQRLPEAHEIPPVRVTQQQKKGGGLTMRQRLLQEKREETRGRKETEEEDEEQSGVEEEVEEGENETEREDEHQPTTQSMRSKKQVTGQSGQIAQGKDKAAPPATFRPGTRAKQGAMPDAEKDQQLQQETDEEETEGEKDNDPPLVRPSTRRDGGADPEPSTQKKVSRRARTQPSSGSEEEEEEPGLRRSTRSQRPAAKVVSGSSKSAGATAKASPRSAEKPGVARSAAPLQRRQASGVTSRTNSRKYRSAKEDEVRGSSSSSSEEEGSSEEEPLEIPDPPKVKRMTRATRAAVGKGEIEPVPEESEEEDERRLQIDEEEEVEDEEMEEDEEEEEDITPEALAK